MRLLVGNQIISTGERVNEQIALEGSLFDVRFFDTAVILNCSNISPATNVTHISTSPAECR